MTSSLTLRKSSVLAARGSFQERSCILSKKLFSQQWFCSSCLAPRWHRPLTPLKNQPPDGVIYSFQLTDGTVMVQGGNCSDWWKLTPDITGSYVNGTWTQLASLPSGYAPYATASAVLADGRLLIEGGEYSNCGATFTLTNQGAIYDPVSNTWTTVSLRQRAGATSAIRPSTVLPNGDYRDRQQTHKTNRELDPKTMKWTHGESKGKKDFDAEEGWTLLADGSILTADVKDAPNSEIYTPSAKGVGDRGQHHRRFAFALAVMAALTMALAGNSATTRLGKLARRSCAGWHGVRHRLLYQEQRPGNTAIYDSLTGKWTVGPVFPNGDNAGDSFAVLLTNGDVLVEGDSGTGYLFDGTTLTAGPFTPGSLMILPNGEVLVGGGTTEVYTSSGTYQTSWQPTISTYPSTVTPDRLIRFRARSSTDCRKRLLSETSCKPRPTIRWCKSPTTARNTCSTPEPTTTAPWAWLPARRRSRPTSTCRRRSKPAPAPWLLWRTAFRPRR
jgi:hypothetical protein